jgi:aldehyde dehydrogenase (NAD+)
LFRYPVDYIFYTGNPAQASEIIRLSAERIIPFTLELGGKNPCIVDASANLRTAARRIVWGKFTNAGQTCIAPDYLLVKKSIKAEFLRELTAEIKNAYGEFPLDDPCCGKIVDRNAYERLSSMCISGRLIVGGEKKPAENRISPSVMDQLDPDDPLLTREVFGPLLGVVEFEDYDQLFSVLYRNPTPLAVYCFGGSAELEKRLKRSFRSGSLVFDDCLTQFVNMSLPFGGVGKSGTGSYHGRRTFECFSHSKSIMRQSGWFDTALRYRGGKLKEKIVEFIFHH